MCDIDPLNSCRLCRQATRWKNLAAGAKGKTSGGRAVALSLPRRAPPTSTAWAEPPHTHASVRDSPRERPRDPGCQSRVRSARGAESLGEGSAQLPRTALMPEYRRTGRDATHSNSSLPARVSGAERARGEPWECGGCQALSGKGPPIRRLHEPSGAVFAYSVGCPPLLRAPGGVFFLPGPSFTPVDMNPVVSDSDAKAAVLRVPAEYATLAPSLSRSSVRCIHSFVGCVLG